MKLSPSTIAALKNFNNINQSICFKPGNMLKTISPAENILAQTKIDIKIPTKFCIHDISRFLNAVNLFDEPELEIEEPYVIISDGKSSIKYRTTVEKNFKTPSDKVLSLPETVPCHFTLTQESSTKLFKAMAILGLPEVAIIGDGKNLTVNGIDSEDKVEDTYSLSLGQTKNKFKVIFKIDNLNKIVPGDYDVKVGTIKDARDNDVKLSHFKHLSEKFEYWIAVSSTSEL